MIDPEEPTPDERERDEAARLAELLDSNRDLQTPAEAEWLDTSTWLAASRLTALTDVELEAGVAQVRRRIGVRERRRARTRVAYFAAASLAAAAAVLLAILPRSGLEQRAEAPLVTSAPGSPDVSGGAQPDVAVAYAALRAAQLAWLDAPGAPTQVTLEARLAEYRTVHLAVLRRRYPR